MQCSRCNTEPIVYKTWALCARCYHVDAKYNRKLKRRSAEYHAWVNLRRRCLNERDTSFPLYGGRGITVCPQWQSDFDQFLVDVGPKPSSKHSLDRIDNDGNYEPTNCRWATKKEQIANRRPNYITAVRLKDLLYKEGQLAKYIEAFGDRDFQVEPPKRGNVL